MFDLTPAERRGALVLLALVALGAVADLLRRESTPALVPAAVPAPTAASPAPAASAPGAPAHPLDLNVATVDELDGLPGIGPVLANRIVAHREAHGPFHGIEDLLAVQGIGPRLVEHLGPRVATLAPRADGRRAGAVRTRSRRATVQISPQTSDTTSR